MRAMSIVGNCRRLLLALPLLALVLGLAQVGSAQAEVVQNEVIPYSGEFTNPCTGTTDFVEGEAHIQISTTVSPSGQVQVGTHANLNVNGDVLSVRAVQLQHQNAAPSDGAPANTTVVLLAQISEPGTADNAYQIILLHITTNANGDVTSMTLEVGEVECLG